MFLVLYTSFIPIYELIFDTALNLLVYDPRVGRIALPCYAADFVMRPLFPLLLEATRGASKAGWPPLG